MWGKCQEKGEIMKNDLRGIIAFYVLGILTGLMIILIMTGA